jgi:hypothetical protein
MKIIYLQWLLIVMNPDNLTLYQVILLHNDHVEEMLYDYPKKKRSFVFKNKNK